MTVIATAGHVDHGKSTFVNFLTEQQTDRLPEEKKRGLTINLGYTHFSYEKNTYSIIDVPGHKDFFKNTISGFSNVDVVLFIIDSVQNWSEQSEQHFQSLISLNKSNFIFVFTKTDLLETEVNQEILQHKIENYKNINYKILKFNKKTSDREKMRKQIHEFIQSCTFPKKIPSLWVDRSFTIDGTGKVITGTANKGFDYENVIYNLHNEKLQIKEVQSKHKKNDDEITQKRIALSLKKTNKLFPRRGDLLTNKPISFSEDLFIELNDIDIKESFLKGTLRIFFGTDNAHIKKIKIIYSENNIYAYLNISKVVPIPDFENLLIQNVDKNIFKGGVFLFFLEKNQIKELNKKLKNLDRVYSLLDIFNIVDEKFIDADQNFRKIKGCYINENIFEEINTSLNGDIDLINKLGVEEYFRSKYQVTIEVIKEIINKIENLSVSNNQLLKKMDSHENLNSQYKKICELLGDTLEVNIIDTKDFNREDLKELFLIKSIYRVNSKIIISDKHLNKLIKLIESLPNEFKIKDFKEVSKLSRKYTVPYLELLDKLGITTKIDKSGTRKKI